MVGREDLANAVGLNSAAFNAARVVGPGLAGLLIVWSGTSVVFFINAASFLAVIVALTLMDRSSCDRPSARGRRPVSCAKGSTTCAADGHRPCPGGGVRGRHLRLQLPDDDRAHGAAQVFHKGAGEYGLLGSIMAIGSLAGALLAAAASTPTLRLVAGRRRSSACSPTIAGLMPTYVSFARRCSSRSASRRSPS